MAGALYLVGTPIGNLGDISPRAAQAFRDADFIAAEDTRVTMKLLNHLEIKKPLVSYYEHNQEESGEKILARLAGGETCVLVTDAGMPAISDPGENLVAQCGKAGVPVYVVPGPCAAVCALALSGLPTGRFTFEGFLSTTRKSRTDHLESLKDEKRTMIFYEAPHKLLRTLKDLLETFGDRRISISRELTKLHEETMRTTLSGAVLYYTENTPRGEFVLILEGAEEVKETSMTLEDAAALTERYRDSGMKLKEAALRAAEETGFKKNQLYDLVLKKAQTE